MRFLLSALPSARSGRRSVRGGASAGRLLPALVLALLPVAGCLTVTAPPEGLACEPQSRTLWFGPGGALQPEAPEAGAEPGNAFSEAFLTDDMREWRSAPFEDAFLVPDGFELEYWARSTGTAAPFAFGGDPGEGYHFFNQVGSVESGFIPSYAIEYAPAAAAPGQVLRFNTTLEGPPGGFVVERGDALRALLTSLVLDGHEGAGHEILYGGATPSRLTFRTECLDPAEQGTWAESERLEERVVLPANRGLLLGAVPAQEGLNTVDVPFELAEQTRRLTVRLEEAGPERPGKNDIDLVLFDAAGNEVWPIGSPYSDEHVRLHARNLAAAVPAGPYVVRINSYSGIDYEGVLTVVQETAVQPVGAMVPA